VLPLANSPGGHRLGVNGLAVDSAQSVLCVNSLGPEIESFGSHGFGMLADQCIDILEDEMALFARGI
jgi:hypothetical protein